MTADIGNVLRLAAQTSPRGDVGYVHAVELSSNHTVIAAGNNNGGQCDSANWELS